MGDHKPLEVVLNAVGTHHRESNVGDQNYSPRIVYQRASKLLSTSCHANLPSAIILQELLLASEYDPTLKTIKECLDTGDRSAAPAPFADLKEEICQKHGIILRNSRIVIPYAPHPRILQLAHEGNQGITKFKQHLRQRTWWPGIDIQAERVPSHGNVTLGNTEHVGRPFRERRVPSYFNDFLLS